MKKKYFVEVNKTVAKMTYKEGTKLDLALQFLEKRKFNYEENMGKIHSVIKGQQSDFLQDKMRTNTIFEAAQHDK